MMIELEDIHKQYGAGESGVRVLHGVTLEIGPGDMCAFMGASGSGKSTLLNILGLLDRPRAADRLEGVDMEDAVPDAKMVWMYREQLAQAGAVEPLFEDFDRYLKEQGYLAMGGQIKDRRGSCSRSSTTH